jgi:hypothetical protein
MAKCRAKPAHDLYAFTSGARTRADSRSKSGAEANNVLTVEVEGAGPLKSICTEFASTGATETTAEAGDAEKLRGDDMVFEEDEEDETIGRHDAVAGGEAALELEVVEGSEVVFDTEEVGGNEAAPEFEVVEGNKTVFGF